MAFAGYSSFASSDLPSALLLSALCPERLLFLHCINECDVLQLHLVNGKHQQDV